MIKELKERLITAIADKMRIGNHLKELKLAKSSLEDLATINPIYEDAYNQLCHDIELWTDAYTDVSNRVEMFGDELMQELSSVCTVGMLTKIEEEITREARERSRK